MPTGCQFHPRCAVEVDACPTTDVELWPGWVRTVPELDWRIELRIGAARDEAEPAASGSLPP